MKKKKRRKGGKGRGKNEIENMKIVETTVRGILCSQINPGEPIDLYRRNPPLKLMLFFQISGFDGRPEKNPV